MHSFSSADDILLVDNVSVHIIDFAEDENFVFIATVCKPWRRSWGLKPAKTKPITASTSVPQLEEAVKSDVSLYRLCSLSVALGRTDLLQASRNLGAPWINAMSMAASLNDLSLVKFMRRLGCPMSENTFEVFSYNGNLEALNYLMQKGCPSGRCVEYAASSENIRTLRWLRDNGGALTASSFAAACLTGNVEVIQWFERNNCAWDERALPYAARAGNIEAVELLVGLGFELTSQATKAAAGLESMEILVWLRQNGCPWGKSTCAQASRDGRLESLMWARAHGAEWGPQVCAVAAKQGHFSILEWARENGCPWDSTTLRGAAEGGWVEILQWSIEKECPGLEDTLVCASAANGLHLGILRWLREEKGFAWDANTMIYASEAGCFDVVEYCLANKCPTNSAVVAAAASANRFQMVKFLVSKGCPVDNQACENAAGSGNVQMLAYFKRRGCNVGIGCLRMARKNHQKEMIAWLKDQK